MSKRTDITLALFAIKIVYPIVSSAIVYATSSNHSSENNDDGATEFFGRPYLCFQWGLWTQISAFHSLLKRLQKWKEINYYRTFS